MSKVKIIAEAGINHNGDIELAKKLSSVAKGAGADYVKFQIFKTEDLVNKGTPTAKYQEKNAKLKDQFSMLKKLELSYDEFQELYNYCKSIDIEFLATPFDVESLIYLVKKLDIPIIKVSSGDLTNSQLVYKIGESLKPVILSTGMASIGEVESAIDIYIKGYRSSDSSITVDQIKNHITILQCTSSYPAPAESVNLKMISTYKSTFGVNTGFSDHTSGIHIPAVSVAYGAQVIEKHFTLDKNMDGPDHKASLSPEELRSMIQNIRDIEKAIGNGHKRISQEENETKKIVRKGIYFIKEIKMGDVISECHITCKRPENSANPLKYWDYIGKKAVKDYGEGDSLEQ